MYEVKYTFNSMKCVIEPLLVWFQDNQLLFSETAHCCSWVTSSLGRMERSHGSIKIPLQPPVKQPIKEIQAWMILGVSAVCSGTPVGPARTGSRMRPWKCLSLSHCGSWAGAKLETEIHCHVTRMLCLQPNGRRKKMLPDVLMLLILLLLLL